MKTLSAVSKLVCVAVLAGFGLSACGGNHDDLLEYIDDVKARPGSPIEGLPDFLPPPTYSYVAGARRSPFMPDQPQRTAGSVLTPDVLDRPREHLESKALDSLRMVGTLDSGNTRFGLVQDEDERVYRVVVGNYMGMNYGRILSITESEIRLLEVIPDNQGGYLERQAAIALSAIGSND